MSTVPRVQCTTISSLRSNVPPEILGSYVLPLDPMYNCPSGPMYHLSGLMYPHVLPIYPSGPMYSMWYLVNNWPGSSITITDYHHRSMQQTNRHHRDQLSITNSITLTKIIDYYHRLPSPIIVLNHRSLIQSHWPRSSITITDSTNWYRSQSTIE